MLWAIATIAAAAAQTARNAMQSSLVRELGTLGATQVRFLYGLPFALLFLALIAFTTNTSVPSPNPSFLLCIALAAPAQIAATALLLAAMRARSFSIATALSRTEAIQTAIFALLILGETLTPARIAAIIIASFGVLLVTVKQNDAWDRAALVSALYGLGSGALFASATIGFRAAILALGPDAFLLRAGATVAWSLALQTALLGLWLLVFRRAALFGSFRLSRKSLFAGLMGAFASLGWFTGLALTSAANVRALGLVEVLFAQFVSGRVFSERATARELLGMALIVAGAALLILSHTELIACSASPR
ncbi:MAG: DMT family transporter [Hyphomonadaceae bacterium]|nr:DMT family transporter [Hyphomonadaceae bacterium]